MGFPLNDETQIFLERLVEEKGFVNLSEKLKADILDGLNARLVSFIVAAIAERLSEEDAERMNEIMEEGKEMSMDTVIDFLNDRVPDLGEVTAGAMMDFRETYLKGLK
ncbi:MAG: hypothetical protein WCL23_03080 [Candidatus Moraniibacteriota bacterium]